MNIQYMKQKLEYALSISGLPEHMHDGIINYLVNGIEPGGFLLAVLENNLVKAFAKADDYNAECMKMWASFLYNDMPSNSWGSVEKVDAWLATGGYEGMLKKTLEDK